MSWRQNSDTTTARREPATPPSPPGPHRISGGRTVILAIVFVALVAGIVGLVVTRGSDRDDTPTQAATGSVPTTAVTAQPDQPPKLVNTGEDWDTIVRSIVAYKDWLLLHPRPELLDEIELPTYNKHADNKLGIQNLATKGWRYDPPPEPLLVQRVSVTTRMSANRVGLAIRFGPSPHYRVVDSSGNVVFDQPAAADGSTVEWTLARTPTDPRWRVEDVLTL